jgi:hypothetical protein
MQYSTTVLISSGSINIFPIVRIWRGLNLRFPSSSIVQRVGGPPVIHGPDNKPQPKAMCHIHNCTPISPSQQTDENLCEKLPQGHPRDTTELESSHILGRELQNPSPHSHQLVQFSELAPRMLASIPIASSKLEEYVSSDEYFERFPLGLPSRRLGRPVLDPMTLQVLEML